MGSISNHLRSNVVGYVALFIALSGTAYALDGPLADQNTVGSQDIINGEVAGDDLAPNAVGTGKIADGSVRNADLSVGASSSNTIADGGIRDIDVRNDTLTGLQIDESTLDGVDAESLDGMNSTEFVQGNGRVIANRVVTETQGTMLLNIPFIGQLKVDGCDHINGRVTFDTVGTGNVYVMAERGGNIVLAQSTASFVSATLPQAFYEIQLARDTGSSTKLVEMTVTWNAPDCVFAASAIQMPAL